MFLDLRADLLTQATRTLGSVTDAEDIVQEVWIRWRRHQPSVASARAWLHTVTKNLALDRLRERTSRAYTGLDDSTLTDSRAEIMTRTEVVQHMAYGFHLVLQSLSPLERMVFVLHEGLAWTYTDIARLLARSEPAVRQLRHRASVNLAAGQVRFVVSTRLVAMASRRYVDVCAGGEVSALLEVLAPDVPLVPPGRRLVEGRLHHEVAGIVLARGNRLLLCHRRAELPWYPDVWDVPGGHLMRGEPAAACAVRAAKKEVGISAVNPTLLAEVSGDDFSMTLMLATAWEGEPHNITPAEHDAIGFFSRDEACRLRLADRRYLELFDRNAR
jgi:RNA polymerase sigma-70 factor (ECF subfamily)